MSSSVLVQFYLKKSGRKLKKVAINQLKYRMENWVEGSATNKPVVPIEEAGVDYEREYLGLVPRTVSIPQEDIVEGDEERVQIVNNPEIQKKYEALKVEFELKELVANRDAIHRDYIEVSGWRRMEYHGIWVGVETFEKALERAEKQFDEVSQKLFTTKAIETTADFFKLNEDEKEGYFNQIERLEEDREELRDRMYTYQYMIFVLGDLMRDVFDVDDYTDDVVAYIYRA